MSGILSGVMVIILLVLFIGMGIWAYNPKNKQKFAKLAKLPLEEDHDRE